MRLVVLVALAGCGRIGFDAGDDQAIVDARRDSADGAMVDNCGIADLALYYAFDETSGIVATDSSGNGHDGRLASFTGETWAPGKTRGSLRFDGAAARISLAMPSELADLPAITICTWVLANPLTDAFGCIADKSFDGLSEGWNFYLRKDLGYFGLFVNTEAFEEAGSWQPQTWQYLCGTWDGSLTSSGLRLYQDDSLQSAGVLRNGAAHASDAQHVLTFGRAQDGSCSFDGRLDELRIYRRALDAAELAALRVCSM